jgi:hypothetical protein
MIDFDFSKSFHEGIKAAQHAEISRAEIAQVIDALSTQIASLTDGKLEIFIGETDNILRSMAAVAIKINRFDAPPRPPVPTKDKWIYARNVKAEEPNAARLAKWEQSSEGYPCRITFNETDVRCHDREALLHALADMLSDAWVGEQLKNLLSRPLATEDSAPA